MERCLIFETRWPHPPDGRPLLSRANGPPLPGSRRTDPRAAMLTGKISFRGEMALGIKLGYWVRKAVKQGAADTGALEENVELEIAETDKWERDEDTHFCAVCQRGFKVGCLVTGCVGHALEVPCRSRATCAELHRRRKNSAFSDGLLSGRRDVFFGCCFVFHPVDPVQVLVFATSWRLPRPSSRTPDKPCWIKHVYLRQLYRACLDRFRANRCCDLSTMGWSVASV